MQDSVFIIFGLGKLGYKLETKFNKNVVNLFANSKENEREFFSFRIQYYFPH